MITEPNELRQEYIEYNCAQPPIDPKHFCTEDIFDLIVDGVGYENTRKLASQHAVPEGVIAHICLGSALGGLDIRRMPLQEITFIGSYTYTDQDFRDTAHAFERQLGPLDWTEERRLRDGQKAFL